MLCFLAFSNTIFHDYAYDDYSFIVNNTFVQQGLDGIPDILSSSYWDGNSRVHSVTYFSYRPIPAITFALETSLFGNNPLPRHIVQILIYIVTCISLYILLIYLFPKEKETLLLLITIIFCIHPLHSEIVSNLKNRDELMGFLFASWAVIFIIKRKESVVFFLLSGIFIVFAFLSKETSGILILAGILTHFWNKKEFNFKRLIIFSPLLFGLCIYFFIRTYLNSFSGEQNVAMYIDNPILLAENFSEKAGTIIYCLGKMIQLSFFPYEMIYDYGYKIIEPLSIKHWKSILSIFAIVLLTFIINKFRKKRIVLFGGLIIGIGFGLIGNIFIEFPVAVAERFLFIPSLGFCILIAWIFFRTRKHPYWFILISVFVLFYFIRTTTRNPDWKNNEVLFSTDILKSPEGLRTNFRYGQLLIQEGVRKNKINQVRNGLKYVDKANEVLPDKTIIEIYIQLIQAYKFLGAKKELNEAIEICLNTDESNPQLLLSLIEMHLEQENFKKAIELCDLVLEQQKNSYQAYLYKGFAYGTQKKSKQAEQLLQKAYQLNPNSRDVNRYLIQVYKDLGKLDNIRQHEKILQSLE